MLLAGLPRKTVYEFQGDDLLESEGSIASHHSMQLKIPTLIHGLHQLSNQA
jgi:hypothetical protein